jgi:hypothetical protein
MKGICNGWKDTADLVDEVLSQRALKLATRKLTK